MTDSDALGSPSPVCMNDSDSEELELELGADCSLVQPQAVILHIDWDNFFLAVHERLDNSLRGVPAALWQYNDVVSHAPNVPLAFASSRSSV